MTYYRVTGFMRHYGLRRNVKLYLPSLLLMGWAIGVLFVRPVDPTVRAVATGILALAVAGSIMELLSRYSDLDRSGHTTGRDRHRRAPRG